jgi:hypothetical protein
MIARCGMQVGRRCQSRKSQARSAATDVDATACLTAQPWVCCVFSPVWRMRSAGKAYCRRLSGSGGRPGRGASL